VKRSNPAEARSQRIDDPGDELLSDGGDFCKLAVVRGCFQILERVDGEIVVQARNRHRSFRFVSLSF
jgi:hypothetical protein